MSFELELVSQIESTIGNILKQPTFMQTALTHRSYVNEAGEGEFQDNERFEFLGDAVLSLAVSDLLMTRFPESSEGALSKYRSGIVNERSLASAARNLALGDFLRLGKGEEMTKGREKDSILANTFEAVVAAIYLSNGLPDAYRFVEHHMRDSIDNVEQSSEAQDYKTALQELTQKIFKTAPIYHLVEESGPDHDKVFESEVRIGDRIYGRGQSRSKKDSEQRGAFKALALLREELKKRQTENE